VGPSWTFRWNWKTAALSSLGRGILVALPAVRFGAHVVLRVVLIELAITAVLGGVYGGIVEAFHNRAPFWKGTILAAALIAVIQNGTEFAMHTWFHNPARNAGVALSFLYTLIATFFTMLFMDHGLLLADPRSPRPLKRLC
jgi:hypothetical protein